MLNQKWMFIFFIWLLSSSIHLTSEQFDLRYRPSDGFPKHSKRKKTLTHSGVNGFCNRLRTLASSVIIAEATNRELLVRWSSPEEDGIIGNTDWSDLFIHPEFKRTAKLPNFGAIFNWRKPTDSPLVMLPAQSCLETGQVGSHSVSPGAEFSLEVPEEYDHVVIQSIYNIKPQGMSNQAFYEKKREFYNSLIPVHYIQKKVAQFWHLFPSHVVGVHVRVSDLLLLDYVTKNKVPPFGKWKKEMDKELLQNSETVFFLSTDSNEALNYFIKNYEDKIIYFDELEYDSQGYTERFSIKATQKAVIDLLLLSKTDKIIGTEFSSFTYEAACIGGIPLTVISYD